MGVVGIRKSPMVVPKQGPEIHSYAPLVYWFSVCLPPLGSTLSKDRESYLFWSLTYVQRLERCLAPHRCSLNRLNEQMKERSVNGGCGLAEATLAL